MSAVPQCEGGNVPPPVRELMGSDEGHQTFIFHRFSPKTKAINVFFTSKNICAYVLAGRNALERESSKQFSQTPCVTCRPHLSWMLIWPTLGAGVSDGKATIIPSHFAPLGADLTSLTLSCVVQLYDPLQARYPQQATNRPGRVVTATRVKPCTLFLFIDTNLD